MSVQKRAGDFIQTFSGIEFYPLDPRPGEILIEDIAHALSLQCRFTGHTRQFYSVAEHSIWVSALCDPADALWGLLHDASEAYMCDVARPIKRLPELAGYRATEKDLLSCIVRKFRLPAEEPESVHRADEIMLGVEARDLMSPYHPAFEKWVDLIPTDCRADVRYTLLPHEAESLFLRRFQELTQKNKSLLAA